MEGVISQCWKCFKEAGKIKCRCCEIARYCSQECKDEHQRMHLMDCDLASKMQRCSACGSEGNGTVKLCRGCCQTCYCSELCQRRHWPQHQKHCKEYQEACLIGEPSVILYRKCERNSYRTAAYKVAEDCLCLQQHEGKNTDRTLHLLFLGMGYMKDVIRTVSELPQEFRGRLVFKLCDVCECVMARNFLFVYCVMVHQRPEHLVQVWYSVFLTPECQDFLVSVLVDLIEHPREEIIARTSYAIDITSKQWSKCVEIWQRWLSLARSPNTSKELADIRVKVAHAYRSQTETDLAMHVHVPEKHHAAVYDFVESGLLLGLNDPKRLVARCSNATFTGGISSCGDVKEPRVHDTYNTVCDQCNEALDIFLCWEYPAVRTAVGAKKDVLEMYRCYLQALFAALVKKVFQLRLKFQFQMYKAEYVNSSRYLAKTDRFDRIWASDFGDYYSFVTFLKQFLPHLNPENEHATVITVHEGWKTYTRRCYFSISRKTSSKNILFNAKKV